MNFPILSALTKPLPVFIGWDSSQISAYDIASYSLQKRASVAIDVRPLKQQVLRSSGYYWREPDPLASTEFTCTRFLVPELCEQEGYAVYCDCDFLWLDDIAKLMEFVDPSKAVSVVQHNYKPEESKKMFDKIQSVYPRKNWSSLMIFNLAHASVKSLSKSIVNTESPKFLHRFEWLDDKDIGDLPFVWNWLEGWYSESETGRSPSAIHYTRGGPWHLECDNIEYSDLWRLEFEQMQKTRN